MKRNTELRHTQAALDVAVVERAACVWTVEAIDADGACYHAVFVGPDAETRAREYVDFKYEPLESSNMEAMH
jgi:hypothetical protein